LSFDDLVAKTVDLSRKLDQWRVNLSPFEIRQHDLKSSIPLTGTSRAEGFQNLLAIHYYRTVLLANGQLLLRILQERTSIRLEDMDISHQIAISSLQRDYTAAKELCWLLSSISTLHSGFFESNATWWVCNYGGEYIVPSTSSLSFPEDADLKTRLSAHSLSSPHGSLDTFA
jgi:hypothetical protein